MKRLSAFFLALLLLFGCTACELPELSQQTALADAPFTVRFFDVGQADSILVTCGEDSMLVDGGNVADGQYVVSALKKCGVKRLQYVFNTHCDEDHCGGLAGVLAAFSADSVYSSTDSYDTKAFSNFKKYTEQQGKTVQIPKIGDTWQLGDASVTLLGPVKRYEDNNDNSLVLRIEYGETSFLLTGDMGREAESDLIDSGAKLSATVLKVGHHGSNSSTGYVFLREVTPQYGVICVGADNTYGHPHEEALSRLRDAEVTLFRTDLEGTVTCTSDGRTVSFTTEKEATAEQINPTVKYASATYIGNKNTKIFHADHCKSLPEEKNRVYFSSYSEALAAGYSPHRNCAK